VERKKTAFLHAHAVQLLLWTWYPADYNEQSWKDEVIKQTIFTANEKIPGRFGCGQGILQFTYDRNDLT
jgi:hypothetical protein